MFRFLVLAVALTVIVVSGAGCKKDKSGSASLNVRTDFPERVPVALLSADRPGTYVERVRTDVAGTLNFTGVSPGKYTLVYQFEANDHVPTHSPYNYGQSDVVEVKPGRNVYTWDFNNGHVNRE